jgi:hypothetical protein
VNRNFLIYFGEKMTKNNNIKDQSICHGRKRNQKSSILKRIFQREIGRKKIVTQNLLQRGKIKLEKVLQREECAIVLGFSSDGNYLSMFHFFLFTTIEFYGFQSVL